MKQFNFKLFVRRKIFKIKAAYTKWRYKRAFECFAHIDKYFPREDINYACEHIERWANFLRTDANLAEKYRQEMLRLKMQLLMSGVSDEAIASSDWSDRCLGINALDAVVPQSLGQGIIDYIFKANLISTNEGGMCVWSANASSQLRQFVFEKLFYKNEGKREVG